MAETATVPRTVKPPAIAAPADVKRVHRSLWGDAWRQYRRHRLAMVGTVVLFLLVLISVFGPLFWRVSPTTIDYSVAYKGPMPGHPLGVDAGGHDMLARALSGGRISLSVGLVAMLIAIVLGTLVGAISGFFGGRIDSFLMRLTDMFLALPQLPLLLMLIYLFRDALRRLIGPELGIFLLMVAVIGGLRWMETARVVRSSFLALKQKEFIEAARCVGSTSGRIMWRHILPNAMSPIIIAATLSVGAAIIQESTLSFLGLGFPPDFPTWGRMLNDGRDYLDIAPHTIVFPGLLIFLAVLSINYMGDGLRDALDPRRGQ